MEFIVRSLNDSQKPDLDIKGLNLPSHRLPVPSDRKWAVNEDESIFLCQLNSNTSEMRDGYYWYALVIEGYVFIFNLYAYDGVQVGGEEYVQGTFEASTAFDIYDKDMVTEVASQAMQVYVENDQRKLSLREH